MNDIALFSNAERQAQIARMVSRQGRVKISDLCSEFGISEATARRDLAAVAKKGLIQRVHGGALLLHQAAPEEPILRRAQEMEEEKRAIGLAGASLIQDGETVFLGSGTTVLEVARNLIDRTITVITNSLPVINLMSSRQNITLVSLGGMLRASELSFIGHITEQVLHELRADRVVIGTRAFSLEHGLTNDYISETLTDRAIITIGNQVVVVADHSKLGRISTAFLAPVNSVHILVTDDQADKNFLHEVRSKGIQVIVASR